MGAAGIRLLKPHGKLVAAWNDSSVPGLLGTALWARQARVLPLASCSWSVCWPARLATAAQFAGRARLQLPLLAAAACRWNLTDPFIVQLEDLFEAYNPSYK